MVGVWGGELLGLLGQPAFYFRNLGISVHSGSKSSGTCRGKNTVVLTAKGIQTKTGAPRSSQAEWEQVLGRVVQRTAA